jgi:hypothetical protein
MQFELLKENQDKINWLNLSLNTNTIELLKENQDKINWNNINIIQKTIEIILIKI